MDRWNRRMGRGGLAALVFVGSVILVAGSRAEMGDDQEGGWEGGSGHRLEMIKEKLGLNDSQASQLREMFKKQAEGTKPLRQKLKIGMDTLRLKMDSGAPDPELKKILDTLSADKKSLEESRKTFTDKLRTVLTPTQQAKFLLGMQDRRRGMMAKRGMGRMGHDSTGADPSNAKGDQDQPKSN